MPVTSLPLSSNLYTAFAGPPKSVGSLSLAFHAQAIKSLVFAPPTQSAVPIVNPFESKDVILVAFVDAALVAFEKIIWSKPFTSSINL